MMFHFPSVICTRCTGFFCLAIIKGPPNDIYCIIEGKRLIFRYDRKIPDYFSVAGAPCYENKTRSKKLNLDNKYFQQL